MSEPITQVELSRQLHQLEQAVAARRDAEQLLAREFGASIDPRQESLAAAIVEHDADQRRELTALAEQHQQRRREIESRLDAEQATAQTRRRDARNAIERQSSAEVTQVNRKHEDARWVAQSVLDETSEESPKRQFERIRNQLERSQEQQQVAYEALKADVQAAMAERNWSRPPPPPPESAPQDLDALSEAFTSAVDAAQDALGQLQNLRVPKLFVGMRPLWLFVALLFVTGVPAYLWVEPSMIGMTAAQAAGAWVAMTAGAALVASLLLLTVLYTISSMQLSDAFSHMQEETTAAAFYHGQWASTADALRLRKQKEFDSRQQKMESQLGEQLRRFEAAHQQTLDEVEARRQSQLNDVETTFRVMTTDVADRRREELAADDDARRREVEDVERLHELERSRLQRAHDDYVAQRQRDRQAAAGRMTSDWNDRLESVATAQAAAQEISQALFPAWGALLRQDWEPPRTIPRGLRLGRYEVDLARLPGGIPQDPALVPSRTDFPFPAVLPFPNGASLLMKTAGPDSRRAALQAMQVYLLRMLTLLPPGKLRLTIFDPVGLGESFSGLMHLADYDELLITSRIWTETAHIEARLAELTEHMENVLQKYLRNEFPSIEAYNDFAGEVAEPYHVLVVADFPNKFSEQAARRLTSIATSGARCGVYLLISADPSEPPPHGFRLSDVEAAATTLTWHSPPAARSSLPSSFPNSVWERTPQSSALRDEITTDHTAELEAGPQSGAFPDVRSQTEFGNEGMEFGNEGMEFGNEGMEFGNEGTEFGNQGGQVGGGRVGDRPAFYLDTNDAPLARWPIVLDEPPPPDVHTQIVKRIGEASKDIRRVEVSFSRIAPPPDDVWSRDSRRGIDVPLGRAGATKLQHLRLGSGTSQHMLVAGKTGSGKSTFFHALITNAALYYSPDELEFYLVDFKKGVEFKAYAGGQLPHARVIAIESDREFGISVLQRLDGILHERGDLFREAGVQDVAGFRDARGQHNVRRDLDRSVESHHVSSHNHRQRTTDDGQRMPRILLVIDEFQEFFVEDDRFSQQAALLLDRLVRQGRAFGIHVVLGSQTLGGAYSLARSTLGQVAVRVALQCSEADAHLILSESNTAARLLTRPGEAIYNDANGMVEGNHPFQIAWLPDDEREAYLDVMQHFDRQRGGEREPAIVFEGNIPSDPSRNKSLTRLIETGEADSLAAPTLWLGEAVEIGPPTFVTCPQQAGSNLLIVGQDPRAAAGILATAYIALAAQLDREEQIPAQQNAPEQEGHAGRGTRLWILDGSHVGSPEAEFWKSLAGLRPELTRIVTPGNVKPALAELTAELERRERANIGAAGAHAPLFVLVGSLSRFRDLRKGDDDFGFGGFGSSETQKPPDAARQFADLIAKGPEQGLHVLAWVDSAGNLDRWLSRQSLKEFELRVTFAMNAGDSSNLIDSPAASRLGPHRALLYREETGTTTKFRPYGPPNDQWLGRVRLHLSAAQPLESAMDLDGFQVS